MNASYEVDVVNVFVEHDEVKNIEKKYIVFEATPFNKEGPMYEQINYYIEMLIERISEHVNEYKKELLKKFNVCCNVSSAYLKILLLFLAQVLSESMAVR